MRCCPFAFVAMLTLESAAAASLVTSVFDYQSTVTSDAYGLLDLKAELNYDDSLTGAPIAVVMHAYSGSTGHFDHYRPNAQRLRDAGFFVVSPAMRGREGSDGSRDSGGLEIHDIYDAVEAVKETYADLVDPTTVYITGYSGGGGNTMSALTKFPDYFRAGAPYFGMSDYGYDPDYGWYYYGAGGRTSTLNADIGNPTTGDPDVIDRYHARASNLASKNNPYAEIHLFVNNNETICPIVNDTSFRDNAVAAASEPGEFDNINVHIGVYGTYEDFNNNGINESDEHQWWPHDAPDADTQHAAEAWFLDRVLSGQIPEPVLNTSDELFVAGYVTTKPFTCWLGDGQNAAGGLDYNLSSTNKSFDLQILSNNQAITGRLSVDTADMADRRVEVRLNGQAVESFNGGGVYDYMGFAHGDHVELVDVGPAVTDPTPPPATPVAHWRFETSPGFAKDSGPNGLDLIATNPAPVQVSLSDAGPGSAFFDPVPQGGAENASAAQLDGGVRFVLNDAPEFSFTDFTIEACFNLFDRETGTSYIASQWASGNRGWGVLVGGDADLPDNPGSAHDLILIASDDGEASWTKTFFPSGIDIELGDDYYVAVSYDADDQAGGVKFYIQNLTDGTPLEVVAMGHGLSGLWDSSANIDIGGYAGSEKWNGLLDEIRITAEVLEEDRLMSATWSDPIEGDLDGDGFVGGDDLDVIRSFWGQSVTPGDLLSGDASGDGIVGGDDLDLVRANWGQGTTPRAPTSIPEPTTLIMLVAGGLLFIVARRHEQR